MKKNLLSILFAASMLPLWAQYVYKIKGDSVLITNDSCNAELIIENSTKHVLGFLYNKGNGRTEFRTGSAIGDFILNQNSSDQAASFRISGSGQVGSFFKLGNLISNPTGSNGMIYYKSDYHKFRGFKNNVWVDILTTDDIQSSSGISSFFDSLYTNKMHFRLGEAPYGMGEPSVGLSKFMSPRTIPLNGYTLSFLKGDNTSADQSNYTHITSNRGITLGNSQNIPEGSLLRVGSFLPGTAAKGTWYSPETSNITPNELVHIYSHPSAFYGTNGTEVRGLLIELDMGTTIGPTYNSKKPIGADIYLRSNSNYNPFYNGDWIGLRLKSVSWNEAITPRAKMYTLWADSGRVYFSDSVMIGTTSPRAKLTHDGTVSFNLGSDATGDIFYRDSLGLFTRLSVGSSGQVLTVSNGRPAWTTSGGGGGSSYTTVQENGTGLTQRSTLEAGYGITATDNSGSGKTDVNVDLTNSESFITSNVSLTANTLTDITSLSLAAGTWLVVGSATVESPNNAIQRVSFKVGDGTNTFQAGEASTYGVGGGSSSARQYVCLPVSCLVVLSGTTTVKLTIASTGSSNVLATPVDNNSGMTNKATSIRAVRIK